ncbi:hypothetical protein PSEUDO9AG_60199 [Pseudomonas sp. 9Ag]|nr:hypothetical protein PSEUDO9AG_60199 [Pseudomonas sp. 9Ag]
MFKVLQSPLSGEQLPEQRFEALLLCGL